MVTRRSPCLALKSSTLYTQTQSPLCGGADGGVQLSDHRRRLDIIVYTIPIQRALRQQLSLPQTDTDFARNSPLHWLRQTAAAADFVGSATAGGGSLTHSLLHTPVSQLLFICLVCSNSSSSSSSTSSSPKTAPLCC